MPTITQSSLVAIGIRPMGNPTPVKLEGITSINIGNLDNTVISNLDDHGASQFLDTMPQTINKGAGYERTSSSAIEHNSGRMSIS